MNAILCSHSETTTSHPKKVFDLNSSFMVRTQVKWRFSVLSATKGPDSQPQQRFFRKLIMCYHNRAFHGASKKDFESTTPMSTLEVAIQS